jgi:hypothetical protein
LFPADIHDGNIEVSWKEDVDRRIQIADAIAPVLTPIWAQEKKACRRISDAEDISKVPTGTKQ